MEKFMQYWPLILAAAPILAKILNTYTPKWYAQRNLIAKIALLVVEFLDMYTIEKEVTDA